MFLRSVRMQTAGILRKKTAAVTYLLLMGFMLVNFFSNLWQNHEVQYVTQMFDSVKILTLSDWSYSGFYMRTYFPILVVLPTACSYLSDRQTRIQVYIEARTGRTSYWMGKLLAVFLATFIIFTLPFLLELALNIICFGLKPMGDPSNFPYLDTLAEDSRIFLSGRCVGYPRRVQLCRHAAARFPVPRLRLFPGLCPDSPAPSSRTDIGKRLYDGLRFYSMSV